MENKVDVVRQYGNQLEHQSTPNKNTVLHVAALYGKPDCVNAILSLCPSSLLLRRNDHQQTALHIAAKGGHLMIVKALVESSKTGHGNDIEMGREAARELIRTTGMKKDTALHEAVRRNRISVVSFLVNEDPDFTYSTNKHGETPLYLAARSGFSEVALEILQTCKSLSFDGPLGRRALHAAVASKRRDLTKELLEKMPELARQGDVQMRTPLHFAAWYNRPSIVSRLVRWDRSLAYVRDNEGMTPLHIAAREGHVECISLLVKLCPDCYEMVDNNGQNAFHKVAKNGKKRPVGILLKNPMLKSLVNEGDNNGNTPLHLLADARNYISSFLKHPDLDKKAVNNEYLTALDILQPSSFSSHFAAVDFRLALEEVTPTHYAANHSIWHTNEAISVLRRMSTTHVVVATLIATVTFAAGFTLPGGYMDNNECTHIGTATLRRKSAFQDFIISNTIAFLLSICAVFTHFLSVMTFEVKFNHKISILAYGGSNGCNGKSHTLPEHS